MAPDKGAGIIGIAGAFRPIIADQQTIRAS
jgi:hypothetical protein